MTLELFSVHDNWLVHRKHRPIYVIRVFSVYLETPMTWTYVFKCTAMGCVALPEFPAKALYVSYDASFVFETGIPAERSVSEHPEACVLVSAFHFKRSKNVAKLSGSQFQYKTWNSTWSIFYFQKWSVSYWISNVYLTFILNKCLSFVLKQSYTSFSFSTSIHAFDNIY